MQRAGGSLLRGCLLLRHLRISQPQLKLKLLGEAPGRAVGGAWQRPFSEDAHAHAHAHGTYLDKHQVVDRVLNVVKTFPKVDPSKVSPSSNFQKDLGLDSLDSVEVVMAFEEEFALEIPDSEADKIASCADAIEYIASHPQAK